MDYLWVTETNLNWCIVRVIVKEIHNFVKMAGIAIILQNKILCHKSHNFSQ